MEKQLVVFELAGEAYGVDISTVESIIKLQAITQLPSAPAFVEGVTNLRGIVLPVIDLRKRFGLDLVDQHSANTRIIVASMQDTKVGMIVDGVSEVLRISDEAVEPPPPMATTVNSAFISGIAKLAEKLVILLDLSRVLSVQEQAAVSHLS